MDDIKPRYGTFKAIKSLAGKLELPVDKSSQDWSYEIADPDSLERYYRLYDILDDDDEKFVLMEMVIQATNDLIESTGLFDSWNTLETRLIRDFYIHEYTVHYWTCLENENLADCWTITPKMRELWEKRKTNKKRILFVCTVNRMRSATAQKIYQYDLRFEVKSAGTYTGASTVLSRELLDWADSIVVMEKHHRNFIRKNYPDIYKDKKIVCLYIPDDYDYMQRELIIILRERFENIFRRGLV